MLSAWRRRKNAKKFASAYRKAQETNGVLCSFIGEGGKPEYFVMDATVSEKDVFRHVFKTKHGRAPYPIEEEMWEWVTKDN